MIHISYFPFNYRKTREMSSPCSCPHPARPGLQLQGGKGQLLLYGKSGPDREQLHSSLWPGGRARGGGPRYDHKLAADVD